MSVLDRFFKKLAERSLPQSPWSDCNNSAYVLDFRGKLDQIAHELRGANPTCRAEVFTRYNRKEKAAEIVSPHRGVLAQIRIRGADCTPLEANVYVKYAGLEQRFKGMFGELTVNFYPLEP